MYNELKKPKDADIYRDYVTVRGDEKGIGIVLTTFGISKSHLYNVIRRVQKGNTAAIRKELATARLQILWKHKYKVRFEALPKNKRPSTVAEIRLIVRAMLHDSFPQSSIARFIKKNRSTIINHYMK